MTDFQIGEKARIKYWNELPSDEDDWNDLFFEKYQGDRVTICYKVSSDTFDVRSEKCYSYLTVDSRALKRDFHIPEHLFEMEE